MRGAETVVECSAENAVSQIIDERVGFGVDVVAIEQHFGEVDDFLESPGQRLDVGDEIGVRPERVEIDAVGFVGRVELDARERFRRHLEPVVAVPVLVAQVARLVEEAEIGAFDVEAERRDFAFVRGKMREDRREQEFDRARLGRESRDARDVEMRGFGAEEKVRVEINRGVATRGRVEADGDGGRSRGIEEAVHPQRLRDIGVVRDVDPADRHGLQRLLRCLTQHRGRPIANLLPCGRRLGARGITLGAHDVLERRREIGIREAFGNDAVHDSVWLRPYIHHLHNRPDADRGVSRGPEMELMRGGRFELGRDDSADHASPPPTGNRARSRVREPPGARGARAFRYSSTSCKGYNSRSQRAAGVASGARSAQSQPLNSVARRIVSVSARASTRNRPYSKSLPSHGQSRRYHE